MNKIFDTQELASEFNQHVAIEKGCDPADTIEWYPHYAHETKTTNLTKAQYAELKGIPEQITEFDGEGEEVTIDNPEYVALENSITVPKWVVETQPEPEPLEE